MAKGRVLLIEAHQWVARLLEEGLRDAGYDVVRAREAYEGFQKACDERPDCIICSVSLPDFNGQWVAHRVRSHASAVSTTPFLFLRDADDETSPLETFHVGAAKQMNKPFRLDEVVVEVDTLVQMAASVKKTRDSLIERASSIPPPAEAMRCDLEHMSLVTVLSILEMERRSGSLRITSGDKEARIQLAGGFAATGTLAKASASLLTILREVLKWKTGTMSFQVGPDAPPPSVRKPIGAFLMEAVQLNDLPPNASRARSIAPGTQQKPRIPTSVPVVSRSAPKATLGIRPAAPSKAPALPKKQ